MAKRLGESVSYTWWAQRRGFVRNTLKAGTCDLWPGVATGYDLAPDDAAVLPVQLRLRQPRRPQARHHLV